MSQSQSQQPFPLNPDFGRGCYRRRIRLRALPGRVEAELEDSNHGLRCAIDHDGQRVTGVESETLRVPFSTCSGASEPLRALIGVELSLQPRAIAEAVNPRANCTHLYDLALLAIAHGHRNAGGGPSSRNYELRVDDEHDGPSDAMVWLDGELIHHWCAADWTIASPAELSDKPLYKGFAAWANDEFDGDAREAAFVLHKGYFVASARRYDLNAAAGQAATAHMYLPGVCHSYSPGIVEQAVRLENSVRDFSDCPEQLLRFG